MVVGTPIAGRTAAEVEGLIGFFVNTLALRVDLRGDPTFAELVTRVRATALGAYAHQEVPFETLVDELAPERSLSRSPLFQVLFALQNAPVEPLALAGVEVEPIAADWVPAHFDLSLTLEETAGGLAQSLIYNTDLYDATTAERLLRRFENLLAAAVAEPERRLSQLPAEGRAERHQMLVEWNASPQPATDPARLDLLFAAQARRTPDAVAVERAGVHLSYGELQRRAGALARRLAAAGVGPEVPVGVALRRTPELVVALLGILEAGGAYVPLDPAYPAERIEMMLADSRARVVVTEEHLIGKLPPAALAGGCRALVLGREWGADDIGAPSAAVDLEGAGRRRAVDTGGASRRLAAPGGAADPDAANPDADAIGAPSAARQTVDPSGAGRRRASGDADDIGAPSAAVDLEGASRRRASGGAEVTSARRLRRARRRQAPLIRTSRTSSTPPAPPAAPRAWRSSTAAPPPACTGRGRGSRRRTSPGSSPTPRSASISRSSSCSCRCPGAAGWCSATTRWRSAASRRRRGSP